MTTSGQRPPLNFAMRARVRCRFHLTMLYFHCILRRMESAREVEKVLHACAEKLKALTEAALADGDFDSVLYVTTVLKKLSDLQHGMDTDSGVRRDLLVGKQTLEADDSSHRDPVQHHEPKGRAKSNTAYPRFRRDGSHLVKVGWSKKSRQEYEHRAAFDVVLAVSSRLEETTAGSRTAGVDELHPLVVGDHGDQVPSYQLYLAIAWLRSERLLNRIGRKGYTSAAPGELAARARERWDEMGAQ